METRPQDTGDPDKKIHAAKIQFTARGESGRHVNKAGTTCTIRDVPTGVSVTASDSRSQSPNRRLALERLPDTFEKQRAGKRQARLAEISKARRQKAKRPRSAKPPDSGIADGGFFCHKPFK